MGIRYLETETPQESAAQLQASAVFRDRQATKIGCGRRFLDLQSEATNLPMTGGLPVLSLCSPIMAEQLRRQSRFLCSV